MESLFELNLNLALTIILFYSHQNASCFFVALLCKLGSASAFSRVHKIFIGINMADIEVIALDETQFQVTVIDRQTTSHHVTVKSTYALQLTQGKISTAELVKQSFIFLLQREPNTSILRNFDLSVIAHYFPEYEQTIQQH
jgi:hypothetical protein